MTKSLTTISAEVYERIRSDILSCRIQPNTRATISKFCEDYDASLGAVREALSRLAAEDLVVSEPRKGFKIAPVSLAELRDLTMSRIEIETLCLEKALKNGGVEWETNLVAAFHRLSRTNFAEKDGPNRLSDAWVKAHSQFHGALVGGCPSKTLLRIRRALYEQSERYRRLSVPADEGTRDVAAEHKALMEAALERDLPKLVKLMHDHLRLTTEILERSIADLLDIGESKTVD